MKAIGIVTILFIIIISGSVYLISREKTSDSEAGIVKEEKKSCCSSDMGSDAVSDNSIYLLESEWKNEDGTALNIKSLKNSNVVLGLIFANCSYACPIIVNDMKRIESSLSKNELKETRFVLVSIDHERDTPEKLKEFGSRMGLDLKRWDLLAGSESDIRELAALLGFKYKKDDTGNYSHSNMITLLDKNGEIMYQHEGLNEDIAEVTDQIKHLN